MDKEHDAARLVAGEVLGYNSKTVFVNDKAYVIEPPTIHKICGATYWLTSVHEGDTLRDLILGLNSLDNACKALSFLIADNDSLAEELSHASMEEVVNAIEAAFDLIGIQNFLKLSILVRSARSLTAKQR